MKKSNTDTYLLDFRKNIYSQFGEDGILEYIFSKLPKKKRYWCVEFGAWDGKFSSNTCALVEKKGWYGIYIEADRVRFQELLKNHGNNQKVYCVNEFIQLEGKNKLDNLLKKVRELPREFDLISLDIDSCEYYVWKSLKSYSPSIVVIEFNPTMPPGYRYVQPKSFDIHDEHSLRSVVDLGKEKGYELVSVTDTNAIFVRQEYFHSFGIADNSPSTLSKPFAEKYQTQLWQGADGTLHLVGCNKLLWHQIMIPEHKIQVLPKYLRFFPGKTHPLLQMFKKIYYKYPVISKVMNIFLVGVSEAPYKKLNT